MAVRNTADAISRRRALNGISGKSLSASLITEKFAPQMTTIRSRSRSRTGSFRIPLGGGEEYKLTVADAPRPGVGESSKSRMSRATVARLLAGCMAIASIVVPGSADPLVARLFAQARERVLYVSVYDSDSLQPVKDLTPENLVVREDGARREVLRVTPATSPMPVAIIVDNSAAASPNIADLRRALTGFIKGVDGLGP